MPTARGASVSGSSAGAEIAIEQRRLADCDIALGIDLSEGGGVAG